MCKYLKKALELKIIDEVHFWNNTRNVSDENFIKSISNLKRTSSREAGNYILIFPEVINNTFELNVESSNDTHIKIGNIDTEYEIVLNGWGNTRSIIRENNNDMCVINSQDNSRGIIKVSIENNTLCVYKNNKLLFSTQIINNFIIQNIWFKTGNGSVADITFTTTQNHGFYFMDTCEKSWKNYYQHYANNKYHNATIIKCDDDIIFIDLNKLPKFIDFINQNDYDLVFANTINNGVSAYFQQNKYNLIPHELMQLEYPNQGLCGTLWDNGNKAEQLHNYFLENNEKFLNYDYKNEIIEINTRFSINFFAYKGNKWNKIKHCYPDDERMLTVDYVKNNCFKNILYSDFYVSHLSFYRQNETGMNSMNIIKKYDDLYETTHSK